MILDFVTLFAPRQARSERTARLGTEPDDLLVYCHRGIKAPANLVDMEKHVLKQLQDGGGLLIRAPGAKLTVNTIPRGDYKPPRRALLLTAGRPAEFVSLGPDSLATLSDHLIVPVDRDADEHLERLVSVLSWFPSDHETMILNLIRSPSLDWRMQRVEERLAAVQASPATSAWRSEQRNTGNQRSRFRARLKTWALPLLLTIIVGAELATVRALWLLPARLSAIESELGILGDTVRTQGAAAVTRQRADVASQPSVPAQGASSGQQSGVATPPAVTSKDIVPAKSVEDAASQLLKVMEKSPDVRVHKLFETYFSDAGSKASLVAQPRFFRAVVKLALVSLGDPVAESSLPTIDLDPSTFGILTSRPQGPDGVVDLGRTDFGTMLAYLSCAVHKRPSIEGPSRDGSPRQLSFSRLDCVKIQAQGAPVVSAIKTLIGYADGPSQKARGRPSGPQTQRDDRR